jgi:hypothetical protein
MSVIADGPHAPPDLLAERPFGDMSSRTMDGYDISPRDAMAPRQPLPPNHSDILAI